MNEYCIVPNPTGPTLAIDIDEELCVGCNSCADICRIQTILPNPENGKPPVVAYPDECWYCGCCVEACPIGALEMRLPINQRILFKDRVSGEIFRLGTQDAPEKSFFKAPYGWITEPELGRVMQALERHPENTSIFVSSETCNKIGRFFGEMEDCDNTAGLVYFLKTVGFSNVRSEPEEDAQSATGAILDIGGGRYHISTKELSGLLHRLCVSNTTAVRTWRRIKKEANEKSVCIY